MAHTGSFDRRGGGDELSQANEQIDLYDRAVGQTVTDETLGQTNVGLGNYDQDWLWMQVESYRKWLFTDAALSEPVNRRVVDYALTQAAMEQWDRRDDEERRDHWQAELQPSEGYQMDRSRWLEHKKAHLWAEPYDVEADNGVGDMEARNELRDDRREELIREYAPGDLNWTPPFGEMLKMRHEASRSLGARLIDNLFGRVTREERELVEQDGDTNGLTDRL